MAWMDEKPGRLRIERGGGRPGLEIGPRSLALLDLFGAGRDVAEALHELVPRDAPGTEIDAWLAACLRLVEAGLLLPAGPPAGPAGRTDPFPGIEEWNYHFRMVTDRRRVRAYRRAIETAVEPGMTVLEIGTGTGILAVMAARAGARVHAVERADVIEMARRTIREAGVEDRVTLHHADSRRLSLSPGADLLLAEMVGNRILNEDLLEVTHDAFRRLLAPGAAAIPRAISILAYPVMFEAPARYREVLAEVEAETGVGLRSLLRWMERRLEAGGLIVETDAHAPGFRLLGEASELARVDLRALDAPRFEARTHLGIREAGELSGVLLAFELDLADGVSLDNRPGSPPTHWKNPLFPVPRPFPVSPGDEVAVEARYRPGSDLELGVAEPPGAV